MLLSNRNAVSIVTIFTVVIFMTVSSVVIFFLFQSSNKVDTFNIKLKHWSQNQPKNMTYKVTHGCMTLLSYDVYRIDGKTFFQQKKYTDPKWQHDIDSLFEVILKAAQSAYSLNVDFNLEYGYPQSIEIDWDKQTIDDECFYVVENFNVQRAEL